MRQVQSGSTKTDSSKASSRGYNAITPLFICIGFPKCATTWIHRQLESHPEIGCTITKEVTYWTRHYGKGIDWYLSQFPKDREYKIFSEVTPHYVNPLALGRIRTDLAGLDVRFMVCLRNPYERTYSHFHDVVRSGRAQDDMVEAIKRAPEIIEQSLYAAKLRTFEEFFPLDRLHIDFYENIQRDPLDFVRRMYQFLGVNTSHVPAELEKKINPGRQSSAFDIYLKKTEQFVRKHGLKREHLVKLRLWSIIERLHAFLSKKNPLPKISESQALLLRSNLGVDLAELRRVVGGVPEDW